MKLPAYSNFFLTKDPIFEKVNARYYYPLDEIPPAIQPSIMRRLQWNLYDQAIYAGSRKEKTYFLPSNRVPPAQVFVDKYQFQLSDTAVTLTSTADNHVLEDILSWALKRRIWTRHYINRAKSPLYYERVPYLKDYFEFHHGFIFEVEVLKPGYVGVWIDPKTHWAHPMREYIRWLSKRGNTETEIATHIEGREVRCPAPGKSTDYQARISNVLFQPIGNYPWTYEGKTIPLYVYWTSHRKTHAAWLSQRGIELLPEDSPVILVEAPFLADISEKPYPAPVVELLIDLSNPEIPEQVFKEKYMKGAMQRIKDTLLIYDNLLLANPLRFGGVEVKFEKKMCDWAESRFSGVVTEHLNPPTLVFHGGHEVSSSVMGKDPNLATALASAGPITAKESVPLTIIIPQQWEDLASAFSDRVATGAAALNLGRYEVTRIVVLDGTSPDDYLRKCRGVAAQIGKNIAVVILPQIAEHKCYVGAKRGLGDFLVRSQMVQSSTFLKISQWDGQADSFQMNAMIRNIAIQIYDKYLEPGESIWHLARPAGGLNPSLNAFFMGFDVSRSRDRKESAAYAAVCDVYGRIITRKVLGSHKGEKILAEALSDWLFEAGCAAFEASGNSGPIDYIFFFKDGPIHPSQLGDYVRGTTQAKDRLIEQGIMTKTSDIKVIAVIKHGARRLYADPEGKIKYYGNVLYFDKFHAMGVTSATHVGTPSALRLGLEYQGIDDMDIQQITHIFNDLRYLDYDSLYFQPKNMLPLVIVHNLANLARENISVPYDPRS